MNHFLQSEYAPVAPDAAGFHIIPVPFERSVSYGCGTERGRCWGFGGVMKFTGNDIQTNDHFLVRVCPNKSNTRVY